MNPAVGPGPDDLALEFKVGFEQKQSKEESQGLAPAGDILFVTIKPQKGCKKGPLYMSVLERHSFNGINSNRPAGQR